ncbi:MAG: hypothetical protein ACREQA_07725 [Candidatus Binatia bacterium]
MTTAHPPAAGETRICPHCKATILKSSISCPACNHVIKYEAVRAGHRPYPARCPLSVEGTIRHPGSGEVLEYSVLLEVHDETGKVISRQVVGVGAFRQAETRTFSLRVEVSPPDRSVVIRDLRPGIAS